MHINHLKLQIVLLFTISFSANSQTTHCDKIKNGTFYFYPSKSSSSFLIIRKDSLQKEIDLKTKDTSFWKAKWREGCVLHEQFLRSSKVIPEGQSIFLKSHTTVIHVQTITNKYYTFFGSIDINGTKMGQTPDTIWFKPKTQ